MVQFIIYKIYIYGIVECIIYIINIKIEKKIFFREEKFRDKIIKEKLICVKIESKMFDVIEKDIE